MATSGIARVQKPAPHFSGTAVVDGTFEGSYSFYYKPVVKSTGSASFFPSCRQRVGADKFASAEISLTTYTSTKQWLILGFIPMAWTFVCPTEIIAFSDATSQFAARGASVLFASTDSEYSLLAWSSVSRKDGGLGKINLPLLSDKNHKLSREYGVLIEEEGIALRGLFIIDPKGIVRQVCPPRSTFCEILPFCEAVPAYDRISC
jgi:peroxiredoxin 2/4